MFADSSDQIREPWFFAEIGLGKGRITVSKAEGGQDNHPLSAVLTEKNSGRKVRLMGIRFLCPNGHRLNVKAHLAGQRGICPECGVSMGIPQTSTTETSSGVKNASEDAETAAESVAAAVAESTNSKPAGNASGTTSRRSGNHLKGATPRVASDRSANSPGPSMPNTPTKPPKAQQTPSVSTLWFVRPPAGGQFGPADETTLMRWIHEKRIVADTYLWREGWPKWCRAGDVSSSLPEPVSLTVATPDPPVAIDVDHELASVKLAPSENLDHFLTESLGTKQKDTRQRPLRVRLLTALGLLLLVVVLLGILVWVLKRNPLTQAFAPHLLDGYLICDWLLT
jgi:hypothetical protein